jgi:hypothetical protein
VGAGDDVMPGGSKGKGTLNYQEDSTKLKGRSWRKHSLQDLLSLLQDHHKLDTKYETQMKWTQVKYDKCDRVRSRTVSRDRSERDHTVYWVGIGIADVIGGQRY